MCTACRSVQTSPSHEVCHEYVRLFVGGCGCKCNEASFEAYHFLTWVWTKTASSDTVDLRLHRFEASLVCTLPEDGRNNSRLHVKHQSSTHSVVTVPLFHHTVTGKFVPVPATRLLLSIVNTVLHFTEIRLVALLQGHQNIILYG